MDLKDEDFPSLLKLVKLEEEAELDEPPTEEQKADFKKREEYFRKYQEDLKKHKETSDEPFWPADMEMKQESDVIVVMASSAGAFAGKFAEFTINNTPAIVEPSETGAYRGLHLGIINR